MSFPLIVSLRIVLAAAALTLLAGGCGPSPDTARSMLVAGETDAVDLSPRPDQGASEAELVQLVQEQPAPEGEGTVRDWLQRELAQPRGQPLFPRWQVQRRAASRFEVRFTYTWISLDNQIKNRGYAWPVDASLRTVGAAVSLTPPEPESRARSYADQQQRRALDPEYNLR